jgi:hypothetical protein
MSATQLGCDRSTIFREVRRRSWAPEHVHANLRPNVRNNLDARTPRKRIYLAGQTSLHANKSKELYQQAYRTTYNPLTDHMFSELRGGCAPERIAGRLPSISLPTHARGPVTKPATYGFMGRARESDNFGNLCSRVTRNEGNEEISLDLVSSFARGWNPAKTVSKRIQGPRSAVGVGVQRKPRHRVVGHSGGCLQALGWG